MNSKSKRDTRSEYLKIPESVRRLLETTATAGWVSALQLADEKAATLWRAKTASIEDQLGEATAVCTARTEEMLELRSILIEVKAGAAATQKQLEEVTALCATRTDEVLALRANLIEVKAAAAGAARAAHDEMANNTRRVRELTEEAQRASIRIDEIASDTINLKIILDVAQGLFAKIDSAQRLQSTRCDCLEKRGIKGDGPTISKLFLSPSLAEPASSFSKLSSADVIAATSIILTAASKLQAISALPAA